jgi:flavin-dependent dehydrogenase
MASSYDIIIVGAGVAGSALAHAVGSSGRRVLLLERDLSEPGCSFLHQICIYTTFQTELLAN